MIYKRTISEDVEYFKDIKRHSKINTQDDASKEGYSPQKAAFPSGNALESLARTNPELFNTKKLRQLKASKNIVETFNKYMTDLYMGHLKEIEQLVKENPTQETIFGLNTTLFGALASDFNELEKKIGNEAAKRAVAETFIPESLTESGCWKLIQIRITKNKILVDALTKMLKNNYALLGLSSAEVASLIEDLNNEESNDKGIAQVKAILKNPKILNKFRLGKNNYDFRPIGGAVIFLSEDPSIQFSQHPSKRLMDIFKYDAIVTGHGYHDPDSELKDERYHWKVQPISTLTKSDLDNMNEILDALKKEGFKNIYIGACNPNNDPISDEFKKDPNFKVHMGRSSVYLENDIINSDEYISLMEAENTISKLEAIYGDEYDKMNLQELYNEIDRVQNDTYIHEGIIDKLVNFVKKAVQFIISIWKRIIGFFKNIFAKGIDFIKDKFGGSISSKTKKPVKASTIEFNGDKADVKDYVCNSAEDVQDVYKKSNKSIVQMIKSSSAKETAHIKNIEKHIESGRVKPDNINKNTSKPVNNTSPKSESAISIFDMLSIV